MFVDVKTLMSGKSEHTEQTIEDAVAAQPERGLFAIADGVGTRLFSRLWAQMLAQHALSVPLLSADPFELEWWLESVQACFTEACPSVTTLPWVVQKKAKQGSASTLLTLAVRSIKRTTINASVVAIGDSCLFIGSSATQTVRSFPMLSADDFEKAPICLPSLPRQFDHRLHRARSWQVQLQEGETILLATDAVAQWLLTHTDKAARWQAFEGIAGMTERTWDAFLTGLRARDEIVDDDATVIIVRLGTRAGIQLGTTSCHDETIVAMRHRILARAVQEEDRECIARIFGDGEDFKRGKLPLSKSEIEEARTLSCALQEVRHTYFNTFDRPDRDMHIERAWRTHEDLFHKGEHRKSVQTLLCMLQANGSLQQIVLPHLANVAPVTPPFAFWPAWARKRT